MSSSINTTISHGVVLDETIYISPLTATNAGAVNNNGAGYAILGAYGTVRMAAG
jgi:hypothetical protein